MSMFRATTFLFTILITSPSWAELGLPPDANYDAPPQPDGNVDRPPDASYDAPPRPDANDDAPPLWDVDGWPDFDMQISADARGDGPACGSIGASCSSSNDCCAGLYCFSSGRCGQLVVDEAGTSTPRDAGPDDHVSVYPTASLGGRGCSYGSGAATQPWALLLLLFAWRTRRRAGGYLIACLR